MIHDWIICCPYIHLNVPKTCRCFPIELLRGGSRAAATSKMECFVIIVNCFQPLTIITKPSILDFAAALDPPLLLPMQHKFWGRSKRAHSGSLTNNSNFGTDPNILPSFKRNWWSHVLWPKLKRNWRLGVALIDLLYC